MAPIPLALTLSNSSTILTWLCIYVPHHFLVLLLLAGLVLVVILVMTGLLMLVWLLKRLADLGVNWFLKRRAYPGPPKSPRAALRSRSDSRHHLCPSHLLTLRCPHCRAEINSTSPLTPNGPAKKPEFLTSPPAVTPRHSSNLSPLNRAPFSPPALSPRQEPGITTPPRGENSPYKEPIRRSSKPPKPRKFGD